MKAVILAGGLGTRISEETNVKLKDLVMLVEKIVGKSLPIQWSCRPYQDREIMTPWKALKLPGWRAEVDLEAGLRDLFTGSQTLQSDLLKGGGMQGDESQE